MIGMSGELAASADLNFSKSAKSAMPTTETVGSHPLSEKKVCAPTCLVVPGIFGFLHKGSFSHLLFGEVASLN